MFPLGDDTRHPLSAPIVTLAIIVLNALVFGLELLWGDPFITRWSLVPATLVAGRDPLTILTAMFLHAGWLHIGGNLLFFWVFGPAIEDVMGPLRFLLFYLLGGLAATLAQVAIDPGSTVPTLGASGAIAAVMGAFLVTYPNDAIRTLLLGSFYYGARIVRLPAILLVGLWFLIQLFSEVGALASVQAGGVAYMAHIGGFLFGAVAARLFQTRARRLRQGLAG